MDKAFRYSERVPGPCQGVLFRIGLECSCFTLNLFIFNCAREFSRLWRDRLCVGNHIILVFLSLLFHCLTACNPHLTIKLVPIVVSFYMYLKNIRLSQDDLQKAQGDL